MNKYQILLDNSDLFFKKTSEIAKLLEKFKISNVDNSYIEFIGEICDGGYFYNRSLQIYSVNKTNIYNDIIEVNEFLRREYPNIVRDDEIFFAQEIFGNQFGFSPKGIIFFNIETGEKEIIGSTFSDWIDVLLDDLDFYSGHLIVEQWQNIHSVLSYDMRLCAIKPFVIGGAYEIENLYSCLFPQYISTNANIARQIYDLPEGTKVNLKLDN